LIRKVQEQLQASPTEETLAPEPAPPAPTHWLRFAYSVEFLIALVAAAILWTQVGGQGHLDLMPWYVKLFGILGLAWCTVRLTVATVEEHRSWNRKSLLWLVCLLLVGTAVAGVTYYYHLHEVPDEPDTDETSATSVSIQAPVRAPGHV
jgi:hypothetical protein